jgi:hypothetical protein
LDIVLKEDFYGWKSSFFFNGPTVSAEWPMRYKNKDGGYAAMNILILFWKI